MERWTDKDLKNKLKSEDLNVLRDFIKQLYEHQKWLHERLEDQIKVNREQANTIGGYMQRGSEANTLKKALDVIERLTNTSYEFNNNIRRG